MVTIHTVHPFGLLRERLNDRQVGHLAVMASLPKGLGPSPRASSQCLWRYDQDSALMHVQAGCSVRPEVLGQLVEQRELDPASKDSRWRVDLAMDILKTPVADIPVELRSILKETGRCYRSRKVVVPESERVAWCADRLQRRGFALDLDSIVISPVEIADLGRRGGGIPWVRLTGIGTVIDPEAWNAAVVGGIGSGRNFGLGLVLATALTDGTHS